MNSATRLGFAPGDINRRPQWASVFFHLCAMHVAITVQYSPIDVGKNRRIRPRTAFHTSRRNCCRGAVTPEGYLGCTKDLEVGLLGTVVYRTITHHLPNASWCQFKAILSRSRALHIRTSLFAVQKGAHYNFYFRVPWNAVCS